MKKGYLLIELILSISILIIVIPSIYQTLNKSIQAIQTIRKVIEINKERLYAFQVLVMDSHKCRDIKTKNNELICSKNERQITYSCHNQKLKRKTNSQVMYLTRKMIINNCKFEVIKKYIHITVSTQENDIIWRIKFE